MSTQTALITGASSGIGKYLAEEFAKHGHPVILVAPVEAELHGIAAEFRSEYGVPVRVIAKDLERPEAAQEIVDALAAENVEVDILVNDAGQGQWGRFWEVPIERHLSLLRLNVEAVLRLTSLFLPAMVRRGSGRILNVASVAGFQPGPLMAVYHATKAFVLSWSEALSTELQEVGVTATALCPGVTDTDFFAKADLETARIFHKAPIMSPQEVAKIGYESLMKGERVIVTGMANKALVFSRHLISEAGLAKVNQNLYQEAPVDERKRHRGIAEDAHLSKT